MQEAQEAIDKAKGKGTKGRKDASKQEAVPDADQVREDLEDGVALYTKMGSAQDTFNDWIKAKAEKSGLLAANVRKYVVAAATDKLEEGKRNAEQLSLLFD